MQAKTNFHRAIAVSFSLYLISVLTTMAGMEIFGWLTFTLALAYAITFRNELNLKTLRLGPPDFGFVFLLIVVLLGAIFKAGPEASVWTILGTQRWILLLYAFVFALRITKGNEKIFTALMVVACVISLNGLFVYLTGWDLVRNKSMVEGEFELGQGRAAGFFSLPTTYAHAVSMTVCFALAALILRLKRGQRLQQILIATATVLLLVSILASLTRGAWISLSVAVAAMAFLISWRYFVGVAAGVAVVFGSLWLTNPVFHERFNSVFDFNFASNSERVLLWKLNAKIFLENPILGVGLEENERLKEQFVERFQMPMPKQGNAHNTYLQWAAGGGVLSLAAYLFIIGYFLFVSLRMWKLVPIDQTWHRTLLLGAIGAQIALHVGGLTDCNFKDAEVQHQFVLVLAIVGYLRQTYLPEAS